MDLALCSSCDSVILLWNKIYDAYARKTRRIVLRYGTHDLAEIFTYQRCDNSDIENQFIKRYIDSVTGMRRDKFGNRFIRVGKTSTCFASHTDTVHFYKCGRQKVYMQDGWAYTVSGYPLGGDDGTGVWIMLNLIHDGISGLYIFHRAEESGGQGSKYISTSAKNMLEGINKVIGLDRKGYADVITHQGWQRTCSDKFAGALSNELGGYKPCSGGIFTDSANYADLIPECTNLSIGYFDAHSENEVQDLVFARKLYHKLRRVRWESLPIERNPKEKKKQDAFISYNPKKYKPTYYEWGYGDKWGYGYGDYGGIF